MKVFLIKINILTIFIFLTSCANEKIGFKIANPASENCIKLGGKLEIRQDAETMGQFGVCVFKNGKECEEWALFRKECGEH